MKYEANVVQLSGTPLVGAPAKVSAALNRFTRYRSTCLLASDYPKLLAGLFTSDAILLSDRSPVPAVARAALEAADIVHIHNDIPLSLRGLVEDACRSDCKYVYQLHSPYREGPLFFPRSECLGFDFSAHLTIPHFHQRFEPNFRMVPNLILGAPSLKAIVPHEMPRILFSPSHKRTGQRWGDKVSTRLNDVLAAIGNLRLAEVHEVTSAHPLELFEFRRSTHVSIDEIVTGAFHQVTLEAMAVGNVAVNGADYFQIATLQALCETNDVPPFFRVTEDDVHERLPELLRNKDMIARLQHQSIEFFDAHLRAEKLVGHFVDVYDEVSAS